LNLHLGGGYFKMEGNDEDELRNQILQQEFCVLSWHAKGFIRCQEDNILAHAKNGWSNYKTWRYLDRRGYYFGWIRLGYINKYLWV
jgi:hypothetical protein